MTRRLARSVRGFARRVQMGHAESVFVVTEGKRTDRWFYDRILRQDESLATKGILIYTVASLTRDFENGPAREGKVGVLNLFRALRRSRQLRQENSSGVKSMVFCVDADHDRFTRRMLRSDHLVYTKLPDVEAHILDSVDLAEVFAVAASVPQYDARQIHSALGDWRVEFARGRLDWMILCCVAETSGASNCPRAGTPPARSTSDPLLPASPEAVEELRQRLERLFDDDLDKFRRHEVRARAKFERAVSSGNAAMTLKGKWCLKFLRARLADELEKILGETVAISEDSVLTAAKAQARFEDRWCTEVQKRVGRTLALGQRRPRVETSAS